MVAPVRDRPPAVVRPGGPAGMDPRLVQALGWSFAGHILVILGVILYALFGPAPVRFEPPPGGPVVDLITPRGDSAVFKVGPLAKPSGRSAPAPKPEQPKPQPQAEAPKPEPPKPPEAKQPEPPKPPEPKQAEPPKPPEPKKAEPPPKPVEPKPKALPEPKPTPPPEAKKPEPKPEPKKPEPPRPEVKKPEPKPQPKKPEPPKPEVKKPEPAAEPSNAGAKPEVKKPTPGKPPAKPAPDSPASAAPTSNPGAPGPAHETEGGNSGSPDGGGGGAGNRSPEFYAYFAYMYQTIKSQWVWAGDEDASLAATVRFSILADGSIANVRITDRSRSSTYDDSALNAVRATGSLTPPPASVRSDFEDVELVFKAGDLLQR